jgi:hypothetical protein
MFKSKPLFARSAIFAAVVVILTCSLASAQFDDQPVTGSRGFSYADYPTLEGVLAAHHAGEPAARISRWIVENGAYIPLNLDQSLQLRAQGLDPRVMASMVRVSRRQLGAFLEAQEKVYVVRGEERRGMSRRQILKMVKRGATNEEIAESFAQSGSRADFSIEEALELWRQGISPATLSSAGRGIDSSREPDQEDAPMESDSVLSLDDIPDPDEPVSLDAIFAGGEDEEFDDEAIDLDSIFDDTELDDEGYLDDAGYEDLYSLGDDSVSDLTTELLVISDLPGARVLIAPGSIRHADLLRQARGAGRTPVLADIQPGAYYVLVQKELDSFDDSLIPAFRTVHDKSRDTRTLIESGIVYYDVQDCCLPKSLHGDFEISRISADQQGMILGDEFNGLPPYLWDGNRFLVLEIEKGRVRKVLKVYRARKSTGEGRMIVASFVPASGDPLQYTPGHSDKYAEAAPRTVDQSWTPPDSLDVEGIGKIYGIPGAEVGRMMELLQTTGKATWRDKSDDGILRVLSLTLDTYGRTRLQKATLKQSGPFQMFATYQAAGRDGMDAGDGSAAADRALGPLEKAVEPSSGLPILTVSNSTKSGALVQIGDGTVLYLRAGQSREITVAPGSSILEARFATAPGKALRSRAHFTYNSKYRLAL